MIYFLDTNAVIALLKNQPASVRERMLAIPADATIALPSVVVYELWYGVARSIRKQENSERLRIFLSSNITVMPFEEEDAEIAGELRGTLEKTGKPIGPYDLMIAAQTLRNEAILVTANVSEFARVKNLKWQDWSR